jgi:hypothetical protein
MYDINMRSKEKKLQHELQDITVPNIHKIMNEYRGRAIIRCKKNHMKMPSAHRIETG